MTQLGHVVFYVRNLDVSMRFYRDAVGLEVCGHIFKGRGVILRGGDSHHALLLIEVGDAPGPMQGRRIGLYHTGWKIGESLDALRQCLSQLEKMGIEIEAVSDHTVSQSIYLRDPDGNEVELFVDNPDYDWRTNDSWMEAPVKPLTL